MIPAYGYCQYSEGERHMGLDAAKSHCPTAVGSLAVPVAPGDGAAIHQWRRRAFVNCRLDPEAC